MTYFRKLAVALLATAGSVLAISGTAQAQYYYDGGPRYYERAPRYYEPEPRYAPRPRYYEPERQYRRDPGYGRGGYIDRDTALRNARALKEAQKRAIKEGRPVPGVSNAPQRRAVQSAPNYAPNSGYFGQTPGYRGPTGPSNDEIYRNRN